MRGQMDERKLTKPALVLDDSFPDKRAPWPGQSKCQRCGRFCKELFPVYCSNPHDGVDYEICRECNGGCGEKDRPR